MKYMDDSWSEKHKELGKLVRKKDGWMQARDLFLELHGKLHRSTVANDRSNYIDPLLQDLSREEYAIMPTSKDDTIAWCIWHMARIEDLTMSILVGGKDQVFDQRFVSEIHGTITDTGNALTDEEILLLSKTMDIDALLAYRDAVGRETRAIIASLKPEDLKKKPTPERLQSILAQGGVTRHPDSIWLLDFWAKKTYAGLLLMPPTRHELLHINACYKMKEAIHNKKRYFLS